MEEAVLASRFPGARHPRPMYRRSWFPILPANPEHPCQTGSARAADRADRYTDSATLSIRYLSPIATPRMVFPSADSPPWEAGTCSFLISIQAKIGKIGLLIPTNEIEDAMTTGICPGGERRPSDRCLSRGSRGDSRVCPCVSEAFHVGEFASVEQSRDEPGVETIQTDDDDSLDG